MKVKTDFAQNYKSSPGDSILVEFISMETRSVTRIGVEEAHELQVQLLELLARKKVFDAAQAQFDAAHAQKAEEKLGPFKIYRSENEEKVTVSAKSHGSNEIEITKENDIYSLCIGNLNSDGDHFYLQLSAEEVDNMIKGIKFLQKS